MRLGLFALVLALGAVLALTGSRRAGAVTSTTFTIRALEYDAASGTLGAALPTFTYIVNENNSGEPTSPIETQRPSLRPTPSHAPLVATGDETRASVTLPDGRYLVSVRAPDHRLWGKLITLPQDAVGGTVDIGLRPTPAPLGKLVVQVYEDNGYTNSAHDEGEVTLAGFRVTLTEQTGSQVTVDYNNQPLCGGDCITGPDGSVTIPNLSPATYNIAVHPPLGDGHTWIQTTTLFGGDTLPAGVAEGSNGTGLGGEGGWADPGLVTSYSFGFVDANTHFTAPGDGSITGQALNWVGWPPYDQLVPDPNEPVRNAFVALSTSPGNTLVEVAQADSNGVFTILGVPAGTYNMAIWDESLSAIMRFQTVVVLPGQAVDLAQVGIPRWFGWVGGTVYNDANQNGVMDPGEQPIPNFPMDIRWRDGSIADETVTDLTGQYLYPQAEGGYLGKWVINENGFTRWGTSGASVHDEHNPAIVTTVPTDQGGGLLSNQLTSEGHRSIVDWGHYQYGPTQTGQIVGITYFSTTRNEFDAFRQKHEIYEPGIPDMTVTLESADGTVLNSYVTDHWQQPTSCVYGDLNGNPVPGLNHFIADLCLEVPINGNQSRDGAFDGGYAFADYCPVAALGFDHTDAVTGINWCKNGTQAVPLVPGDYVTHAFMPTDANGRALYRTVQEGDVNVDLGTQYVPAIEPPNCAGALTPIDTSNLTPRSYYSPANAHYNGITQAPLCDKKLVHLVAKQNANADFHLMTNFPNAKDVAVPGRIIGLVTDNVAWERDIQSIWYGEPRPVAHLPIGVYDYAGRLLMTTQTDQYGGWETIVPSTETFNCPIPQGPCPGMYVVKINDPGSKAHPNANYNPKYLGQVLEQEVWPGQMSQMDIPVSPVAGTGCYLPTGTPEVLQVSKLVERPNETGVTRRVTLEGDFFGAAPGRVTITDALRPTAAALSLTVANGGIVTWSPGGRLIQINVPAVSGSFLPGPKQVMVTGSNGMTTVNGITIHVLGTVGATAYNPPVVDVPLPTDGPHVLQAAIDGAAPGSIVVLAPGIYRENVLLWKPLTLQGRGVGGNVGTSENPNVPADDPRTQLLGSGIDGRFFDDNELAWNATLAAHPLTGTQNVSKGADITVGVTSPGAAAVGGLAALPNAGYRIDGVALTTGRGRDGAGGIQVHAYGSNLQITNNVLESDSGATGGGINLGVPFGGDRHNNNVTMKYLRVLGSGGNKLGGAITLFTGSNAYDIGNSTLCANFSNEYGGGVSHYGLSPNGSIHDNRIYYNDSVDSGAGVSITQEVTTGGGLGAGTGTVSIERNQIQSNMAGDDGGGLWVQGAHTARVLVRNNMIVANGAADAGGGIALGDSSNVVLVNDTVADNITTATYPGKTTWSGAGLFAHANTAAFQAVLGATAPHFADPAVMFNSIFWQNEAFTPNTSTVPPTLTSHGYVDFEIEGVTGPYTFGNARFNLFTDAQIRQSNGTNVAIPAGGAPATGFPTDPAQNGNIVGVSPLFILPDPPVDTVTVSINARDPQLLDVQLVPPDVQLGGNYHLQRNFASGALDRGVRCSNYTIPPPAPSLFPFLPFGPACPAGGEQAPMGTNADIDGQMRPQTIVALPAILPRPRTLWDLGADEVTLIP